MASAVIRPLVEQHAEDASFLWLLRDAACRAPHYSLADLAKLDCRLESQLAALRLDLGLSWRICKKVLKPEDAGELFVLSVLALERGESAEIEEILEVGATMPHLGRGLVSALGWLPYERVAPRIKSLLAAEAPDQRRVGIAATAVHRQRQGNYLLDALQDSNPALRARAFRAAGQLGLVDTHLTLRANLRAKDPTGRFCAAWSNALLVGSAEAVAYLQEVAEAGGPSGELAAQLAMRRLPPNHARIWLKRLVKDLGRKRIALTAAGAHADPEAIPILIDQMKDPGLARVAGESFSLITGANIAHVDLDGVRPDGMRNGPTEDPADEDVAMDPDENLPWPDPALVQNWWSCRQGEFSKGTRYILGRPINEESLRIALKTGYQRQRAAAALELAILHPGRPLFEVRAPGFRQVQFL